MAEHWNAEPPTLAPRAPQALTQGEIDQRVFDLYDEYCTGASAAASSYSAPLW